MLFTNDAAAATVLHCTGGPRQEAGAGSSYHDALKFLQKGQSWIYHRGFTGRNLEQDQAHLGPSIMVEFEHILITSLTMNP